MRTLTPQAQLELLQRGLRSGIGRHLHRWLIGFGLALGILGLVTGHPVPLIFGAFLGLIGLIERRAIPNIAAALQAYASETARAGRVTITTTRWDSDDHFHALVHQAGQPDWSYEFIPQGWQPQDGTHAAQIWRLAGDGPPALVMVEQGVLVPRYPPQLQDV